MDVVETTDLGQYFIAIIKGHPGDLAWYEDGKDRGDYIIGRKGLTKYYLLHGKKMSDLLNKSKLAELTDDTFGDDNLFLDLPLLPGKKYGDPEQVARPDNAYSWFVESARRVSLNATKGLSPHPTVIEYELRFHTNPDHEVIKFVDGVGITGFKYVHHGTVSETDLRLIEFHNGVD